MLATENEDWGFYGTIKHDADPDLAWESAFKALKGYMLLDDEVIRHFLDSKQGRHFADNVSNFYVVSGDMETAVKHTVSEWNLWRISQTIEREYSIPSGLPYLEGWLAAAEVELMM